MAAVAQLPLEASLVRGRVRVRVRVRVGWGRLGLVRALVVGVGFDAVLGAGSAGMDCARLRPRCGVIGSSCRP